MRDAQNIEALEKLDIDMMGFIFYEKSPRCAKDVLLPLTTAKRKVGVFVNQELSVILDYAKLYHLDTIQLHGQETVEFCQVLKDAGYQVIKAFSIENEADLQHTKAYESVCHLFLFDTKCSGHGGSGKQFDWNILQHYDGRLPFLLSGGITPQCADRLKAFKHPKLKGYDLNSCFEITPGLKDINKIKSFLDHLK